MSDPDELMSVFRFLLRRFVVEILAVSSLPPLPPLLPMPGDLVSSSSLASGAAPFLFELCLRVAAVAAGRMTDFRFTTIEARAETGGGVEGGTGPPTRRRVWVFNKGAVREVGFSVWDES